MLAIIPAPKKQYQLQYINVNYPFSIMENLPLPFFVVITQLLSCIVSINDSICILNGSPGQFLFMIIYDIQKLGVTRILQILST